MIVIATNNVSEFLPNLLSDLEKFNITEEISIIDTQSNDLEFINYLFNLKLKYQLNINVYQTPYRGFDTGAYVYAINNLKSDRFIFLQDSIKIKTKEFFDVIDEKLKLTNIVCVMSFIGNYWGNYPDSEILKQYCEENFGSIEYDVGIYGPMFSISYSDSQLFNKNELIYPINKLQQMAMERCWPILFKKHNLSISAVEDCQADDELLNTNGYKYIEKYRPYRL